MTLNQLLEAVDKPHIKQEHSSLQGVNTATLT